MATKKITPAQLRMLKAIVAGDLWWSRSFGSQAGYIMTMNYTVAERGEKFRVPTLRILFRAGLVNRIPSRTEACRSLTATEAGIAASKES